MSRCFPFPPPGYEKKARTDDVDLPTKEKHKEKKHKKNKGDKEKRRGKEKKDKERSKDKHREQKDLKEKHKDKKKDKDRDKDKNRTLDEKKVEGFLDGYNGQKHGESSKQAEQIKNSKFVEELGRRIRDGGGTGNQMVENFRGTDQRRAEGTGGMVEKDVAKQAEGKEKFKDKNGDNKSADRNEVRGMGNAVAQNFTRVEQGPVERMVRLVEKEAEKKTEGKEKIKDKNGDNRRADRNEARGMGNAMVQNFTRVEQGPAEGMVRLVEKDAEKKMEGKEKNKDKEGHDKRADRHKDRDREKKHKTKDKDKDKEKKKKEKNDHKNKDKNKLRASENVPVDTVNINSPNISKNSEKCAAAEGNHKKRKDFDTNGFLHDNEIRPSKLPRPVISSSLTGNGRKLDPCQTTIQCASNRQGAANNLKEHKVNGIIEVLSSPFCSTGPSFATVQANENGEASTKPLHPDSTVQANENGEASTKPPHPDSKYLSQVLSVPKMEEYSDFDDQEWLFKSELKKPKVRSSGAEETPLVWDKALQIESADVCALPYVIPY